MRRGLLLVAAAAILGTATPPAHAGTHPAPPGSGDARAVVVQAGPVIGSLAATITLAQSIATSTNATGRAQSRTVDPGLFGLMLTTPLCPGRPAALRADELPPTVRARTGDPGAQEGKTYATADVPAPGPVRAVGGEQRAWAGREGSARAVTTLAAIGADDVVVLAEGRSEARTDTSGPRRAAVAVSTITTLDLFGVRLEGLRWEAHHSGTGGGSFSLSRVTVAGLDARVEQGDHAGALAAANAALEPSGLALVLPEVRTTRSSAEVTPLRIAIHDSTLARQTVRPLVAALQPLRQPWGDALTADCSVALLYTAVDLALDATAGNGGFVIEFGGAWAASDDADYASPFARSATTPTPAVGVTAVEPGPAAAADHMRSATAGISRTPTAIAAPQIATRKVPRRVTSPRPRDAAAIVGLAGLTIAAAMAGAERARARRVGARR